MLNSLEQYSILHRLKRSESIRYFIRMGMVYVQMLDHQQVLADGVKNSLEKEVSVGYAESV